jgi:hypothetical protein
VACMLADWTGGVGIPVGWVSQPNQELGKDDKLQLESLAELSCVFGIKATENAEYI